MQVFLVLFMAVPLPILGLGLLWLIFSPYPSEFASCFPALGIVLAISVLSFLALMNQKLEERLFWWSATLLVVLPLPVFLAVVFWQGNKDYGLPWVMIALPLSVLGALLGVAGMVFASKGRKPPESPESTRASS